MNVVDVIVTKRDGRRLSDDQIRWFIHTYATGDEIADEQASALLMAIVWRGMEPDELAVWTEAMIESGERLNFDNLVRPTVDKHSTGGVGDKLSLVVVPLLAACGAAVPQLSGRGLGHTGGTLDKMEAISGWSGNLTEAEIHAQLASVGGIIAGATRSLAPADRKLYALRDVTGTVESIPLIASSIMSKKIAEGSESLVLDVKVGRGAFMHEQERARELAEAMVQLGNAHGVRTTALLTSMDSVLGRTAGNALEVAEAIDVLEGHGPCDVTELSLALADEMADLAGVQMNPADALASGDALEAFRKMVSVQGGDLTAGLPTAPHQQVLTAPVSGWVNVVDAYAVGIAAWRLGAGRSRKEDPVSAAAGVVTLVRPGDEIVVGQPIFELHADDPDKIDVARETLADAIEVTHDEPAPQPLVLERIA